jgi:methylmalonyl-CoA/ethylmalonyl-CoA epimerase
MTGPSGPATTTIRRLDHVGLVVHNTETALLHFRDRLGLAVVMSDEIESPRVRLTYLDCGNAYLQLVQPLDPNSEIARFLEEHGEGIHHICFGVDDVPEAVAALTEDSEAAPLGSGRGRVSAFVPGPIRHGVRVECTEFRRDQDVDGNAGWLPGTS